MLAQDLARRLRDGRNPLADQRHLDSVRHAEKARQMTFDACARAFIKAHRASWRNPKHAKQWESTLATYASPVFGELSVADVDTAMVVKVLGSGRRSATGAPSTPQMPFRAKCASMRWRTSFLTKWRPPIDAVIC